jgi:hypothetical protein
MNEAGGLAGNASRTIVLSGHSTPQRVVKHAHFGGAGHALQEVDGFGIINPFDFLFVPEILDRASVRKELESHLVEREFRCRGAQIVDGCRVSFDLNGRQRNARRGLVGVGDQLLARRRHIIQGRLDVRQRDDCDLDHSGRSAS